MFSHCFVLLCSVFAAAGFEVPDGTSDIARLTSWTNNSIYDPLRISFSIEGFNDGKTVLNWRSVITTVQGAPQRGSAFAKFSVTFPLYCMNTNFFDIVSDCVLCSFCICSVVLLEVVSLFGCSKMF